MRIDILLKSEKVPIFPSWLQCCIYCCCWSLLTQSHLDCSTPGLPVLYYLPEFAQTHIHWINDAIQLSHPLLPPSPPDLSFPTSGSFPIHQLRIRRPKCWRFSFSISSPNEYSGLISFRIGSYPWIYTKLFHLLALSI